MVESDFDGFGNTVFVGYSSRNRAFTHRFFRTLAKTCVRLGKQLVIVIIDEPYAWNDAASYGRQSPSAGELAKARTIGKERTAMVTRAIKGFEFSSKILRWREIAGRSEVTDLMAELSSACLVDGLIKQKLIDEAKKRVSFTGNAQQELFLNFQIHELPALIWIYYKLGYLIDIYPGPAFSFFDDLERGVFSEELPLSSQLCNGKELLFVECLDAVPSKL